MKSAKILNQGKNEWKSVRIERRLEMGDIEQKRK